MTQMVIHAPEELPALASELLQSNAGKRVFAFYGEMGAGKTTLIRMVCEQLGVHQGTASPTFGLVHEYLTPSGQPVYHMDLYRINKPEELYDIGAEEYIDSGHYVFIEWPEIIESMLPDDVVKVCIEGERERIITF
jgi:tRNA threonylcarbamoyladenosine biosynthesis protein TsaE